MKKILFLPITVILSGCFVGLQDFKSPNSPSIWASRGASAYPVVEAPTLKKWWKRFEDPILDTLVEMALKDSPDRTIAEALVLEARGLRRSSRSFLFPQIGLSGENGRQDRGANVNGDIQNFYDVGFDASYEVDIFGVNQKKLSASELNLQYAEESYKDVSLTLIAELVRNYIDFRASQNQYRIAKKNLNSQQKTLDLVRDLNRLGSAPRLDVERARKLVSTTQASLPQYRRLEENARLRLSVLTGAMPGDLITVLEGEAKIPGAMVQPVLMAPASVLSQRPDIRAASRNLQSKTKLGEASTAELFPSFTLRGFYGITDNAAINSATIWTIAAGMAISVLDFGRIEGEIDAARARERIAFEEYRKTMLEAVVEVETALNDYSYVNEQYLSLKRAYKAAKKALDLSEDLYKEGEISFLDVLDAQRIVNDAESSVVSAKAAQSESLVRIFKSLGSY